MGVVMNRFFVPNANVAVVRRVSRCRDIVTISRFLDGATNFVMTRLSQWTNEFHVVAMELRIWRCRDGATIFAMTRLSRYCDEATNFALSLWSDDYRDGAIELKIPRCKMERRFSDGAMERQISRCRDGTMDFTMSRWSDDFPMVDGIAICET